MICVTPLQRSALGASVFVFAAACVEPPEEILSPHGPASAIATACDARPNDTVAKLTECVTLDGVIRHLVAFQLDADANGGHRMSGTLRHEASADYVTDLLGDAGYAVTSQSFQCDAYVQMSPTILEQLAPSSRHFGTAWITAS